MSYSFKVMSEEELSDLIQPGIYEFEVSKSVKKVSKSGNEMAAMTLNVWDLNGRMFRINDYLVFSENKFCMRKVKHFCESTGLQDEYNKGEMREDMEGLCGKVKIEIEDEMPNSNGGFYPKKNIVSDYIKSSVIEEKNIKTKTKESNKEVNKDKTNLEFNDDVPF